MGSEMCIRDSFRTMFTFILKLLRHRLGLSPPEVAGLVEVEALVPRPLDQAPLAALLLPHGGVETPGVGVIVTIAIRVGLKQRRV